MKRLSDFKGDEALDLFADIIEPLGKIFADKEIQELSKKKGKVAPVEYVKPALKNHKDELYFIMAKLEGMEVEEYKKTVNGLTFPMQILTLVNDPITKQLFTSQSQTDIISLASSGSAMESTEAKEN